MANGLFSTRQPHAGFTAVFLSTVEERPWFGFGMYALVHALVWTVLPSWLYPNLPLDLIEALTYGREWQLGYDKLPPLPWWMVEVAHRTAGSDFAYYCLGQLSVLTAFAAVFGLMLRIASPGLALAAVLIIDGLHFFNFTAAKFNHDVVQLPFWALAGLSFHAALRRPRLAHWLTLGAALGAALWAKYFVVVLALPLGLFVLLDRRARAALRTPGPYAAIVTALVVASPHLLWLVENDFQPFGYADARSAPTGGILGHLTHPAAFLVGQLFWLLPCLIIALPLFQRPPEDDATAADAYDRRIIALLAFGPAAAVIAGSAITGRTLVSMWGYPLWLFLGPWIVITARARMESSWLRRMMAVWAVVTALYAVTFVVQYEVLPHFDHRYRAVLFPGDRIAQEIAARFRQKTGDPIAYVVGTMWVAGNIAHYAPEHPRPVIDGDPRRVPWIDLQDLAQHGAAVAWTLGNPNAVPEGFGAVASRAILQPPFTLPARRGLRIVTVGWAIIPPAPKLAGR